VKYGFQDERQMNTNAFMIMAGAALGLIILSAVIGNMLESSGIITREGLGSRGISVMKVIQFVLFGLLCFSIVPLVVRAFVVLQLKIGNAEFFLVRWIQAHEQAVVYGFWGMMVVGLCLSLPAAIKEGFFK
jgi:hypothetical protein